MLAFLLVFSSRSYFVLRISHYCRHTIGMYQTLHNLSDGVDSLCGLLLSRKENGHSNQHLKKKDKCLTISYELPAHEQGETTMTNFFCDGFTIAGLGKV